MMLHRTPDMLHLMQVFCAVVRHGSFSEAALDLGVKTSSASKAVSKLEGILGVTLLQRSTRAMSLTEPGDYFYRESLKLIDRVATVESTVALHRAVPMGRLSVSASVAVGQSLLAPALPRFQLSYPDISVELILTDDLLDIRAEGIDVALRSSLSLKDSALYSRQVSSQPRLLVASPDYLARAGVPESPVALEAHAGLVFRASRIFDQWELTKGGEVSPVTMKPVLVANNYRAILHAARGGVGIANLFHYLVADDLARGTLVPVLPGYALPRQNIHALYHQKRGVSAKLDAFLDFLLADGLEGGPEGRPGGDPEAA